MLVVNRGYQHDVRVPSALVRALKPGFVGDHFRIGVTGEVWVIDSIRTWADASDSQKPGDLFETVSLYGGIETPPPPTNQPPQPDCDCHNLMAIRTGTFSSGADRTPSGDVVINAATAGIWQVDFPTLHWSVPGGMDLQFGVVGKARQQGQTWSNRATRTGEAHALKVFDAKGKLEGPFSIEDNTVGFNIQVWAHKSAPISIRSSGDTLEVALRSEGGFDSTKADAATLRFGPRNAAPVSTRQQTTDGRHVLVARFRRADAGIPPGVASVCLIGRQQDGVPFEGCDLVSSK